jgi:hypothetical protein
MCSSPVANNLFEFFSMGPLFLLFPLSLFYCYHWLPLVLIGVVDKCVVLLWQLHGRTLLEVEPKVPAPRKGFSADGWS